MSFFSGPLSSQDIFHLEQTESRIASKSQARHTIDGRNPAITTWDVRNLVNHGKNPTTSTGGCWISEPSTVFQRKLKLRLQLSATGCQDDPDKELDQIEAPKIRTEALPADRCQQEETSKTRPTAMTTSLLGLKRHSSTSFFC